MEYFTVTLGFFLVTFSIACTTTHAFEDTAWSLESTSRVFVKPANFTTAQQKCSAGNSSLPCVIPMLNYKTEYTLWLPVVRSETKWKWIDGKIFEPVSLPLNYPLGYDCAIARTKDQFVDVDQCTRRNGFVCRRAGYGKCPEDAECFQNEKWNIVVYKIYLTWYEAHNFCRRKGTDMAIFDGESLSSLSSWLHQDLSLDGHFWIGLTKALWIVQPSHRFKRNASSYDVPMYNWGEDEPSLNGNCVVMSTATFSWKVASCSSEHGFVCQSLENTPVSVTATRGNLSELSEGTNSFIGITSASHNATVKALVLPVYAWCVFVISQLLIIGYVVVNIFLCVRLSKKNCISETSVTANEKLKHSLRRQSLPQYDHERGSLIPLKDVSVNTEDSGYR